MTVKKPELGLTGLHHVAVITSDYETSKHFYCTILGLTILSENYREEKKSYKLDLLIPGTTTQIELFSFENRPERPSYPEAKGLRHLAFSVENVEKAKKYLEQAGVAVEDIRVDPFTNQKFTFLADPDDLPIEIYENSDK